MSFSIISALPTDAPALAALVNGAYRGETARKGWTHEADLLDGTRIDAETIHDMLQKPGHQILKYVEDNKLLGCVELMDGEDRVYLGMLTVRPDLQGKGIGKALLSAAEAKAKGQHRKAIYMTVISIRHSLIAWYNRNGYHPTGERKPFQFSDPRFGKPKIDLEFMVLEKKIG